MRLAMKEMTIRVKREMEIQRIWRARALMKWLTISGEQKIMRLILRRITMNDIETTERKFKVTNMSILFKTLS